MSDTSTASSVRPEQVARAFLTPRPPTQRQALMLDGGESLRISTPEGEIALQRAGTGPAVLLLHGWEGQASDLAAFAPPLLEAGFAVLAMDLPAHGASAGRQTSIPHSARALHAVAKALGTLHAVIGHSIGSAVLVEALHSGLSVQRAALISAPGYYERYARSVGAAAGLDAEGIEAMLALLCNEIGVDLREISVPRRAPYLHQPALFIHSSDDRVVAIEDSLASAAAWPGARHLRVEGLGHRRILTDPTVIATVIKFITITD
jgi:pimeloyl-ACP methyl ester carboxylesterase